MVSPPRDNITSVYANFTGIEARLRGQAPSLFVPNVPKTVLTVGTDFDVATYNGERFSGNVYVNFIGKKNLTEDGLLQTSAYTRINAELAYSWPSGWTVFTQGVFIPATG